MNGGNVRTRYSIIKSDREKVKYARKINIFYVAFKLFCGNYSVFGNSITDKVV